MAPRRSGTSRDCCPEIPDRPHPTASLTLYICHTTPPHNFHIPIRQRPSEHGHFRFLMVHWDSRIVMEYQLRPANEIALRSWGGRDSVSAEVYRGEWPVAHWLLLSIHRDGDVNAKHVFVENILKGPGDVDPRGWDKAGFCFCPCYNWARRIGFAFLNCGWMTRRDMWDLDRFCECVGEVGMISPYERGESERSVSEESFLLPLPSSTSGSPSVRSRSSTLPPPPPDPPCAYGYAAGPRYYPAQTMAREPRYGRTGAYGGGVKQEEEAGRW